MNNLLSLFSTVSSSATWYLLLTASFIGGIVASISPCSLAMLPLIIGYVGGCSNNSVLKTTLQIFIFILGSAMVFSAIGIICAITGSVFATAFGTYFTLVIASLILVIGLKLLEILDFDTPSIIRALPQNDSNSLFLYPFLLGITFAFAGTPCSTPILAGIMAFASIGKNLVLAILMLFLFALGQGVILILAGLFTSKIKNMVKMASFTDKIVKSSGFLLIMAAFYMYWRIFTPLFFK